MQGFDSSRSQRPAPRSAEQQPGTLSGRAWVSGGVRSPRLPLRAHPLSSARTPHVSQQQPWDLRNKHFDKKPFTRTQTPFHRGWVSGRISQLPKDCVPNAA